MLDPEERKSEEETFYEVLAHRCLVISRTSIVWRKPRNCLSFESHHDEEEQNSSKDEGDDDII